MVEMVENLKSEQKSLTLDVNYLRMELSLLQGIVISVAGNSS